MLTTKQVEKLTGLSKQALFHKIRNDQFPRPENYGSNTLAMFCPKKVEAWINGSVTEAYQIAHFKPWRVDYAHTR